MIPGTRVFLWQYVRRILPLVKKELKKWEEFHRGSRDTPLKALALKSLREKAFHAIGGGAFLPFTQGDGTPLLRFIVSFQTISDYLDTLCDENRLYCEKTFRRLHSSLRKALMPYEDHDDYYQFYPFKEDGGYLLSLVEECQEMAKRLPGFFCVQERILELTHLYIDLQSLKHLSPGIRERRLIEWAEKGSSLYGIDWYEFAAASGSTLGIFSLLSMAGHSLESKDLKETARAYFPWVSGLHILLDYLIDLEEDREEGELNFVSFYPHPRESLERMKYFYHMSFKKTALLPLKTYHHTILKGLLALYLSDSKRRMVPYQIPEDLLAEGGGEAIFMHRLCLLLRRVKVL